MSLNNDFSKLFGTIQLLSNLTETLQQYRTPYIKAMEPITEFQKQYAKALSPIQNFMQCYSDSLAPYQNLSSKLQQAFIEMANSGITHLSELPETSAEIIESWAQIASPQEFDDYVTIDEEPIKEFLIPDTIAIPIGHNRIRIKTDTFIAIIGIILTIIFGLSSSVSTDETPGPEDNSETIEQLLNEEQKQTEILHQILESLDASNSSQKEYFEDILSAFPIPEEVPDSSSELTDNMNE